MRRTIRQLTLYQFEQYVKTNKYVMPFIALLVVQFGLYMMIPVDVVSSFIISGVFIFLIMVWIGVTSWELEDQVSEQVIILRIRSEKIYYVSTVVFLGLLSIYVSILALIFPLIQNVLNNNQVFIRQLQSDDIICAFLLISAYGFAGGILGSFFHPRIMRDRKTALTLTLLIAILSVTKLSVKQTLPSAALVTWVVPPVSEAVELFQKESYFVLWKVVAGYVMMVGYAGILAFVKIKLLIRNKF